MQYLIEQFTDKNFLITTDAWFTAPDGAQYRSVWGKVAVANDNEILGIKTNARSSNWFAIIGEADKRVIIAGCQIHYACLSPNVPFTGIVKETRISEVNMKAYDVERECIIYIAQ